MGGGIRKTSEETRILSVRVLIKRQRAGPSAPFAANTPRGKEKKGGQEARQMSGSELFFGGDCIKMGQKFKRVGGGCFESSPLASN